jgi:hypothetical protein
MQAPDVRRPGGLGSGMMPCGSARWKLSTPFSRYSLSGFMADFGDGIRLAAFPLLAVQFTRSATAAAAVTAVQSLPWLVFSGGFGVLVEGTDRRRLMEVLDLARAAIIASLAAAILTHSAGLALIYLAAFTTGVGSALRDSATVACGRGRNS